MTKLFNALHKPSKIILIAGFGALSLFLMIAYIFKLSTANQNLGGAYIFGLVLSLLFALSLCGAMVVGLCIKKLDKIVRIIGFALLGWFVINTFIPLGEALSAINNNTAGITVTQYVFLFLVALSYLGAAILMLIGYLKQKNLFKFIALFVLAGACMFFLIAFSCSFKVVDTYILLRQAWWGLPFENIAIYIIEPALVFFGALYLLYEPVKLKRKKVIVVEEDEEEAPKAEEKPEEKPVEKKAAPKAKKAK